MNKLSFFLAFLMIQPSFALPDHFENLSSDYYVWKTAGIRDVFVTVEAKTLSKAVQSKLQLANPVQFYYAYSDQIVTIGVKGLGADDDQFAEIKQALISQISPLLGLLAAPPFLDDSALLDYSDLSVEKNGGKSSPILFKDENSVYYELKYGNYPQVKSWERRDGGKLLRYLFSWKRLAHLTPARLITDTLQTWDAETKTKSAFKFYYGRDNQFVLPQKISIILENGGEKTSEVLLFRNWEINKGKAKKFIQAQKAK